MIDEDNTAPAGEDDTAPVEYAAFRFKKRCGFGCGVAVWYNPPWREIATAALREHAMVCESRVQVVL